LSIVAEWVCVGHKSSTSAPLGVLRRTLSTPGTSSATHGPSLGAASSKSIKDHPEEETHFGFKTVKKEEKASLVGEVFHRVASNYDLMNDVMSAGIHRYWKDKFVTTLNPLPDSHILDVAGGTGDIAFRCLDRMNSSSAFFSRKPSASGSAGRRAPSVTVCDINPSMLSVGKERGKARGYTESTVPSVEWVVGDAEQLPIQDESMDAYTIAFGIRNCTRIEQVLKEAHRVLKKGGRFMCLEFSHLENHLLQQAYDAYSFQVIPVMGHVVAGDMDSYQYLVESIRRFPRQEVFADMIGQAGFRAVTFENLTFGVAAIHSGWKL
jgi:2-methoxy-6-polyprenyl-1,4-benzoquinol methylase